MKKVVLKLDLYGSHGDIDRQKQKAIEAISTLHGIDQIVVKQQKMTVVGAVDPVRVVERLRKKRFTTHIVSVGPAKEEKKDGDEKKGGDKKVADNTNAKKKGDDSTDASKQQVTYPPYWYWPPQPQHPQPYYIVQEEPNSCVICGSTHRFPCPFWFIG